MSAGSISARLAEIVMPNPYPGKFVCIFQPPDDPPTTFMDLRIYSSEWDSSSGIAIRK
jgi:hypothetical protein